MSTLKVAAINHPSASTGGLTISTGGIVTGGGLDYITSSSFTTASTVSVDGCFTGAYQNYRIVFSGTASPTAADNMGLRMRVSGVDNSAASYTWTNTYNTTASGPTRGGGTTTSMRISTIGNLAVNVALDIHRPAEAAYTGFTGNGVSASNSDYYQMNASGIHYVSSSFDGFSIIPDSGTITGTLTVFGYRKA